MYIVRSESGTPQMAITYGEVISQIYETFNVTRYYARIVTDHSCEANYHIDAAGTGYYSVDLLLDVASKLYTSGIECR